MPQSLSKKLIANIAADYIDWAASGFPGRPPLFTKDPAQFFGMVLDNEIGRIIDESGFGFLCDGNLQIDISAALQLKYRRIDVIPPRCSFSDIKNNVSEFLDSPLSFDPSLDVVERDTIVVGDQIDSALDGFASRVDSISERVTLPGRLAEIEVAIESATANVGDMPSFSSFITDPNNPHAFASYETRDDCVEEYIAQGAQHSFALTECTRIYESASNINERTQDKIDSQEDMCKTGDEFYDDILCAVAEATLVGIVRKTLEEGIGAAVRGGGTARLRISANELTLGGKGSNWVAARLLGFVGDSTKESSEAVIQNFAYAKLISTGILIKDRNDLLLYARNNLRSSIPPGYICLQSDGSCQVGYRNYSGKLDDVNKVSVGLVNPLFVSAMEKITRPKTVSYSYKNCNIRGCPRETRTKIVTGPVYRQDLQRFSAAMGGGFRLHDAAGIDTLRKIYEATVRAKIRLAGEEDEYEKSQNPNSSVTKFRNAVIASGNNAEKISNGTPARSVIVDFIIADFESKQLPVFVPRDLAGQFDCPGGGDLGVYENVAAIDGQYFRTNCTLDDFFTIIDTTIAAMPKETADIVHFIYAMAQETGFIALPDRSAQEVLSSYPVNQGLAEKYQSFGRILVGDSQEDTRILTQNWGNLTPAQAKRAYIESFENKVERYIAQKFYEFTPGADE